ALCAPLGRSSRPSSSSSSSAMRPLRCLLLLLLLSYSAGLQDGSGNLPDDLSSCVLKGQVTCFEAGSCATGNTALDKMEGDSLELIMVNTTKAGCKAIVHFEKIGDAGIARISTALLTGISKVHFTHSSVTVNLQPHQQKIVYCSKIIFGSEERTCALIEEEKRKSHSNHLFLVLRAKYVKTNLPVPQPTIATTQKTVVTTTKAARTTGATRPRPEAATTTKPAAPPPRHDDEDDSGHQDHHDEDHDADGRKKDRDPKKNEETGVGKIVAIVFGVIIAGVLVVFVWYYIKARKLNKAVQDAATTNASTVTGSRVPRVQGGNSSSRKSDKKADKNNNSAMQKLAGVFSGESSRKKPVV
ncbi:hypothetical protein PENTCL1PPCAC_5148, partial [Pristionchus entomophagus]